MLKSLFIILIIFPFVSGSYFRKEKIISLEEIRPIETTATTDNKSMLRGYDLAIRVNTNIGNSYIITKTEDGEKITDADIMKNWIIINKKNIIGSVSVGEILDSVKNFT